MSVPSGDPESGGAFPANQGTGGAFPARVDWGWIGECWNVFWRGAGVWFLTMVVYGIVNMAIRVTLSALFPGQQTPLPATMAVPAMVLLTKLQLSPTGIAVSYAVNWLVGAFQAASLYAMAVKQIRGHSLAARDIVGGGRYYGGMLVLNLLMALLFFAGALVFCVGFFVAWAFVLIAPALVVEGDSAIAALSRSFAAMKQDWLNGTLFLFAWTFALILSAIPCGLGLLVTLPMQYLLAAVAYRDMVGIPGVAPAGMRGYGVLPQYDETQPGSWPPAPGQAYNQNQGAAQPWASPLDRTPNARAFESQEPGAPDSGDK